MQAQNPENSSMSKSALSQENKARSNLIATGRYSIIDKILFPLYEEAIKVVLIPTIFYHIVVGLCAVQLLTSSIWPSIPNYLTYDDSTGKFLYYWVSVVFLCDIRDPDSAIMIEILCYTVIVFLIVGFNASMAAYYYHNRRFIHWTLYVSRVLFEFIPVCLLTPIARLSGMTLLRLINSPTSALNISVFVISLIIFIMISLVYYTSSSFLSLTPYLSSSPTTSWDGELLVSFPIVCAISQFFPYFLSIFSSYITAVWILLKIAFDFYIIMKAAYQPFVQISTNALLGALYGTSVVTDFIAFVSVAFNIRVSNMVKCITMFCMNSLAFILLAIIYKIITNNVKKKLQTSSYENGFDPIQVYTDAKLDTNMNKCELYLRVGLTETCPMFLDWSLVKFISAAHPSMVFSCVRFVSFFPSESHLMNLLFSQAACSQKLKISQRFLLYQIHKLKGLRQSSASFEITEALVTLQSLSRQMSAEISGFWKAIPSNPSPLYELKVKVESIRAKFTESLAKWPNNVKLHEDFHSFLIESAMQFYSSLKIKNQADLVERGKNFAVDNSFRSLIKAYPMYLKKGIVDTKGRMTAKVYQNKSSRGSDSNGSGLSVLSTGTIDGELDIELEENLAKSSFTYPRLRLAYERSLNNRSSKNSRRLKLSAIWAFLVMVGLLLFSYFFTYSIFDPICNNMHRQFHLCFFKLGIDNMLCTMMFNWLDSAGLISSENMNIFEKKTDSPLIINLKNDPSIERTSWITQANINFDSFITEIIEFAAENKMNLESDLGYVLSPTTPGYFCQRFHQTAGELISFQMLSSYLFQVGHITSYNMSLPDFVFNQSNLFCETINNYRSLTTSYEDVALATTIEHSSATVQNRRSIQKVLIPISICIVISTEPFLILFTYLFFRELSMLLKMMKDIDPASQLEATRPMKIGSRSDDLDNVTDYSNSHSLAKSYYYIQILLPIIIGVALFVGSMILARTSNDSFHDINLWMYEGVARPNYIMEICGLMMLYMGTHCDIQQSYVDNDTLREIILDLIDMLSSTNIILMEGDKAENLPSIVGKYKEFDDVNFVDSCVFDKVGNVPTEESYKCFSASKLIIYYTEFASNLLDDYDNKIVSVDKLNHDLYHLFNIANYYLLENTTIGSKFLTELADFNVGNFREYSAAICFGGIAFIVFSFIFFWYNMRKLDVAFSGAMMLMKRLPPATVIASAKLLDLLFDNRSEKKDIKMSTSKSVIHLSNNAVICLSRNESIEIVNQSVTNLFGYMPDQLLGQSISTLFPLNTELEQQFALMRNGEASMLYETSCIAISDDEQKIPVHMNLLGVTDSNQSEAKSFVIVLRDETVLKRQQEAAERAKASSESLLYQILPRDIVSRINRGETDISFAVPIATIVFVDIVRFSDYAATLTPAQIMESISLIFAGFDRCTAKHNTMTKIKLIGDIYMAAAGLFTAENMAQEAAVQVVQFGLDVLQALDEVNGQLDSSLQVRIGVNTDGPIIAGVLGTDKPIFDIIGDPINVASRLQSNGIPNTIQVSQRTYDKIVNMNFNIETRGEIELKGKGRYMAYIVRPQSESFYIHDQTIIPSSNSSEGF